MKTVDLIADKSERADIFIAEKCDISRSHVKKLCDENNLFINGAQSKGNRRLRVGDNIKLVIPERKNLDVAPENIPLDIVYQDDDLAVINKPQGMVVHAGNGTHGKTLVNALLYHLDNLSGINGVVRPGIVHRIDKNTSGLIVVAKNDAAHISLQRQIQDKTCARVYIALVCGELKTDNGIIETYISRDKKDRTKMTVSEEGRKAITEYKAVKRFDGYTLCEFSLKTGRTHQIRVHCKYLGHPIVGDPEYGYKNCPFNLNGQLLHAEKLEFIHPRNGEKMSFSAPIPDYFQKVLSVLERKSKKEK